MKTLIIYDNEGYIISTRQGQPSPRVPVGVPYLEVEIPQGKQIKITDGIGVDVTKTPHEVILEDIPPTETQQLKLALAELGVQTEQNKLENQLAIAELATQLLGGDE